MAGKTVVKSLDHIVLTVRSIAATVDFYTKHLGMRHEIFRSPKDLSVERHALVFGSQKINLHLAGHEFEPKATTPLPGTADICFLTDTPIEDVLAEFKSQGLEVLEGGEIVSRIGAAGNLKSVYVWDPNGNLVE